MKKIKLFDPVFDKKEKEKVLKTIESGYWASGSGVGQVEEFEKKFKKYVKTKSCVAVNSGTAALHLAVSMCDVKNKEVILPSLSFASTAHSILYNGGIPVFVDIDPKTMCIDYESIKNKISSKTKCIIPVHFGGWGVDINEIKKKVSPKIKIIEDAAHACGTEIKKEKIGSHGQFVCFSFHPVKNLAMPSGGLIAINDKKHSELENALKSKRWCGITNRKDTDYDVKEIGWNYYMNEFSAAIGLVQLKKIQKMNEQRKKIAKIYENEIDLEEKIKFSRSCSYHLYWIRVKNRNEFRKKLDENSKETGTHYKPIHELSLYKKSIKLPITEKISKEIVTIPIHPNLKINEIEKIIRLTNKFAERIV